jgi:hypothetical protein
VARHYDDGLTLEVNRTCTDGTRNANSMLYGAVWRAAKAMLTQPLEVIADAVVKNNINPQPKSGRQERLENLWNHYI